jgi:hypothetical protein
MLLLHHPLLLLQLHLLPLLLQLTLLLREIDGDLEHTRMHTLLLKAALNWERRDFDKSMLLSAGPNPWSLKELSAARRWLRCVSDEAIIVPFIAITLIIVYFNQKIKQTCWSNIRYFFMFSASIRD